MSTRPTVSVWPPYPAIPRSSGSQTAEYERPSRSRPAEQPQPRTAPLPTILTTGNIPGTQSSQTPTAESARIYISLSTSPNTRHPGISSRSPPTTPPNRPLPTPPSHPFPSPNTATARSQPGSRRNFTRRTLAGNDTLRPPGAPIERLAEPSCNTSPGSIRSPSSAFFPSIDGQARLGLGINGSQNSPPTIHIEPVQEKEKEDTAGNIATRLESRLWRFNESENVAVRWLLEILSWLLSAVCMTGIVVVLAVYQHRPVPTFPGGLTLNTYISVLSRIATSALLLPTSEALGQLKWSWFQARSRKMWDFEIFDNASRGPWGSLMLIVRLKGRTLAAVGATVTILAVVVDPFFQQVVTFPAHPVPAGNGSVSRTITYVPDDPAIYQQGQRARQADQALQPVAQSYFYGEGPKPILFGNTTRANVPLGCPTGNCSWPSYDSLAICGTCDDVSEYLTWACLHTRIDWQANLQGLSYPSTWPNATACGWYLNATGPSPVLMSGYKIDSNTSQPGEALISRMLPLVTWPSRKPLYGGTIRYGEVRHPIVDFIVSGIEGDRAGVYANKTPTAHECVINWCTKTFQTSYVAGNFSEDILATYHNSTPGPFPWFSQSSPAGLDIFYLPDIEIRPPASDTNFTFGVANTTQMETIIVFDDILPSFTTIASEVSTPQLRARNQLQWPLSQAFEDNPWAPPNNVTDHVVRLASALTDVVRAASMSNETVSGPAYASQAIVQVTWAWLILPLLLLFFSMIFLIATIVKSSKERAQLGVWKNSSIATLLYGLPDQMQNKIALATKIGTPRSKAKELRVQRHTNRWRLSSAMLSPGFESAKPSFSQV